MEVKLIEDFYVFNCPQCNEEIIVFKDELNCKIFRHAIYKNNYQQVDPHLPERECYELTKTNSVYGCCKPFEIIYKDNKFLAVKCVYK
jgi:hypothetical protein